ncbi:ATP-binding protein [Helicobacter sp. 23-1045]
MTNPKFLGEFALGKIYRPKSLARRLVLGIFSLIFIVQVISIAISAIFLNESHKNEAFADLEVYANILGESLGDNLSQNLLENAFGAIDSHYRISIIDLSGKVIFDNKIDIATLDNHLHRAEVQNLLQGKSPKVARLSDSELKENLYFTRFITLNLGADSQDSQRESLILRVSKDKDSLFAYLKNFTPLFATLLIFSAIFSVALGILLSRKILNPIKNIDLSHPIRTNPYAELHIFMQQISKQKKKIKKQLKRIKQGKMSFELITKNMNEGFLVVDWEGNITQCNAKALQILKTTQNSNIFSQNPKFGNAVQNSIDSGNESFEITLNEYFCAVICMPIFVKSALKAIIILLFDKSTQRDILALRKEFSANVTHELKTPLSSILLSAEMLSNNLVAERDKAEFIAKIYAESKRLLTLIEKILKISFLEEVAVEKERLNLSNIIRQILPNIEILAREKGIKCEFVECEELVDGKMGAQEILGIPALLEDMVYNLCENAIKYSGENGAVKVILDYENGGVVLRVVDNGIGIAPNECERIFERFYCVDKSRSKNLGGNGLGLAIVKRIAKIHNATISVHSELGKGSEFEIRFLPQK